MQHSNVDTAKSNDIDHWLKRSRRERTGLWTIMSEVCPLKPTQTLLAVLDSPRRVWYCLCCLLRNVCPLKPLGQTILDPLQSQQSYSEIPLFKIDFSAVLGSPKLKKKVLRFCAKISNRFRPLWPHTCSESKSAEAMSLVLAAAEVKGSDTVYVAFSGMFVHWNSWVKPS